MPWGRDDKPARPEGPRESLPEQLPVQRGSRGPSGRTDLGPISQGIGLRPQPWAGFYRPVRPGGCLSPYLSIGWRHRDWYRQRIVVPASCVIAAVGLYWSVQRVFF